MRHDRDTLRGLLERVRIATASDRDLDRDIHVGVGLAMEKKVHRAGDPTVLLNAYTASSDAAAALIQACGFAACHVEFAFAKGVPCEATIPTWKKQGRFIGRGPSYRGHAHDAPHAMLTALLIALLAHQETRTDADP